MLNKEKGKLFCKYALGTAMAMALVHLLLNISPYRYLLTATPEQMRQWYPTVATIWLTVRYYWLLIAIVTTTISICGWILFSSRKKEAALAVAVTLTTLLALEIILRIAGYRPGKINYSNAFHEVDKLVLEEGYLADENGMTYINPLVADRIHHFLSEPYGSVASMRSAYYMKHIEWSNMDEDFILLTKDYGLVLTGTDTGAFAKRYAESKARNQPSHFDSLLMEFAKAPINKEGFRSIAFHNHSPQKRILMIGDSFTYGYTTDTKTHSFYDLLLAAGYEVYNTGLTDADPPQYLAVAKKYVPLLKPDLVLVNFYLGNDNQYFHQDFGPHQTYFYRTNAGYLQSCPLGVQMSGMQEAYELERAACYIPNDRGSVANKLASKTVLTTLAWNILKDRFGFPKASKAIQAFNERAAKQKMDHPDANDRFIQIKQLCEANGSKLVVAMIPCLAPDGSRNILYANSDKQLFRNQPYIEPQGLTEKDYCTGSDYHFNEAGHKKYAQFLKGVIDSVAK